MKYPKTKLRNIERGDVKRIIEWIQDDEISDMWFGRYSYGDVAHLGYDPKKILNASQDDWDRIFNDKNPEPHRAFFSVLSEASEEHIGEAQLFIDEALGDAQLSVIIGRKDLWHKGYGSSTVICLMHHAFNDLDLYRIWVDIPEFNTHARNMFDSLGFNHEGTLRQSRPHHGSRQNSAIMGMLRSEFLHIYGENIEEIFS
tara:strand:+ start:4673 stop:5272 length:600 start_codon:yes stop_codon:yes gene_type:complete